MPRQPANAAAPAAASEELFFKPGSPRMYVGLAALAILVAIINLLTSPHDFWAKWPITTFAFIAALQWARTQNRFDRRTMALIVAGLGLVAVNLLTGGLWVQWPLLAIGIMIAIRWIVFRR